MCHLFFNEIMVFIKLDQVAVFCYTNFSSPLIQFNRPVKLDEWRGKVGVTKDSHLIEFDKDHYLVKEEMTHFGTKKLILKEKKTGKIVERII